MTNSASRSLCGVDHEGDDEAQLAIRFNLFHLLIAAPRHDDRVNIGAKSLSGFGYRGHAFWDTEIFMLPVFTYTAPHIAKNLLNYRYRNLPAARRKAHGNGFEGAQFPWESANTGDEVTPSWVPHFADPTKLVRIWTGDIEIHISADIAHAAYQYWQATGDDTWFIEKGAEIILDTAKFWSSCAKWNAEANRYEYNDVIGPDEYHEHVNNNAYTNRLAQWNLYSGLEILEWLRQRAPKKASQLVELLDLSDQRLAHWREVAEKIHIRVEPDGLIEQFTGYFDLNPVDMASYEPRTRSFQEIFGVEGANEYQVIKQPDVVMMQNGSASVISGHGRLLGSGGALMSISDQQIFPAVEVNIQEDGTPRPVGGFHAGQLGNLGVGSVAAVQEQGVARILLALLCRAQFSAGIHRVALSQTSSMVPRSPASAPST